MSSGGDGGFTPESLPSNLYVELDHGAAMSAPTLGPCGDREGVWNLGGPAKGAPGLLYDARKSSREPLWVITGTLEGPVSLRSP